MSSAIMRCHQYYNKTSPIKQYLHALCGNATFLSAKTCRNDYLKNQSGAVAIIWALALPMVIAGIGLAVDVGSWYSAKRDLQNATDLAAISAGYDITGSYPSQTTMWYTASNELTRAGFSPADRTLTVNYPPSSGAYAGNSNAVEVITIQPQKRFFSRIFLPSDPNAYVRAVGLKQSSNPACVLALANSGTGVDITGSSNTSMINCVIASNSTSSASINISGSAYVNVQSLYMRGGYNASGSSTLITSTTPTTNGAQVTDPYSSTAVPSYSGCTKNNYSSHGNETLSPGTYCRGLKVNAHDNITLNPGVYIIDRGTFDINGQGSITGSGVTIILTSSTGSDYAYASINGGATVTISAPTSGSYSGMAFYQDSHAPINNSKFNGGSTMDITGVIYMPKGDLTFNGGNSTSGSCTKIVSNTIAISGNNQLTDNCPTSVTDIYTNSTITLAE